MTFSFEQGPIRPPSEHKSLLIRLTRNCPWNKCVFCHSYRDTKFSLRSVEEVKQDIEAASQIAEAVRALSWKLGEGGCINERVANSLWQQSDCYDDSFRSIAAWLYYGGESVFLQDADSLILKTKDLVEILSCLRETFPSVKRITSYCRSKTAARKSVEEFRLLRDAGLSRIHIGMESGYDPILKFIRKGVYGGGTYRRGQENCGSGDFPVGIRDPGVWAGLSGQENMPGRQPGLSIRSIRSSSGSGRCTSSVTPIFMN